MNLAIMGTAYDSNCISLQTVHEKKEAVFEWRFTLLPTTAKSDIFMLPGIETQQKLRLFVKNDLTILLVHTRPLVEGDCFRVEHISKLHDGKSTVMPFKLGKWQTDMNWQTETEIGPLVTFEDQQMFHFKTTFLTSTPKFLKKIWQHDDDSYLVRLTVTYGKKPASKHLERYRNMFLQELGTDCEVLVDGKQIKFSKAILMSQSELFRNMIEANLSKKEQSVLEIADFDYDTIYALIGYMYSETVDFQDMDFALNLLAAATKYGVEELKDHCQMYVVENVNSENAWKVMNFAKLHKAKKAAKAAISFLATCDDDEIGDLLKD